MVRKNVAVLLMCIVFLFGLAGCGGGGGGTAAPADGLLTGVNWMLENSAPDYSSSGATCHLDIYLYYDVTLAQSDISGFVITSPTGGHWSVTTPSFGTNNGKPYVSRRLYYNPNPYALPFVGTWTAQLNLSNGATSTPLHTVLHEPGSTANATHQYLYTKEDFTPPAVDQNYVAALLRFPSQGLTVQYSPANGGIITSTGLSALMTSYLAAEPKAFNLYCWLYDASNNYLGYTIREYSTLDHSSSNLITSNSELSITPAATLGTNGSTVSLSSVKFIRILCTDGAQYAPASFSSYENRSVSSLIPVN